MIYLIIFVSMAAASLLSARSTTLTKNIYFLFLGVLFVMTAFRWSVGCDFFSYRNQFFNKAASLEFIDTLTMREPAYWATQIWIREVGFNWEWINVLSAIAFYVGLNSFARRQPNPLLFLTLCFPALVIGLAMSAIRQAAAVGFLCFAFNAFAEGKWSFYIGFVLVAAMFHQSAIAFLAAAPFVLPLGRNAKIAFGVITLVPSFTVLTGTEAYETYSSMYVGTELDAAGGVYRALPVTLSGLWFYSSLRDKWQAKYPADAYFTNIFSLLLLIILPMVFYSSILGDRFGYYMMPVAFAIQSRAYLLYSKARASMAFILPLAVGLILLVAWIQLSWIFEKCYLPYQTWLDR